jgi:hypothetical protein
MSADGAWKTTINSPMGVQEGTLTIKTEAAMPSPARWPAPRAQDISGKVDGDTLTWGASSPSPFPMTLEFTVTVDGDKMTGSVKAGSFGSSRH